VQSVPAWVRENIEGVGEANLSNLRAFAAETGHADQTDRRLNALRGTSFKGRGNKFFYAVGQRTDNVCLFYTGYFQGKSYATTAFGRQTFSPERTNKVMWTFFSHSKRDHIELEYVYLNANTYIADVIDGHEWKTLTDAGAVFYQRGRNFKLEHYPETTKGWTGVTGMGNPKELVSLELIGITTDRIALYRTPKGKGIFTFVIEPNTERTLRRLFGYSKFGTDREYELGEFGTIEMFVKTLGENDEWNRVSGETQVTEKYEQFL
jgi:hypothetical protein